MHISGLCVAPMKILLLCVALLLIWDNGMVLGEQEVSDNELQGR